MLNNVLLYILCHLLILTVGVQAQDLTLLNKYGEEIQNKKEAYYY
ncbi:hypothetical protein [Echinicola rosea]|nr:hypothetical protein [Echinicola rosea]